MSKILLKIIKRCSDCPYLEYDSYYDRSKDSGYNCSLLEKRLWDDCEIKKVEESTGKPFIFSIPEDCPLPNEKEIVIKTD